MWIINLTKFDVVKNTNRHDIFFRVCLDGGFKRGKEGEGLLFMFKLRTLKNIF